MSTSTTNVTDGRHGPQLNTPLSNSSSTDHLGHESSSGGVQMILRIKRKRNQDPVDALIIHQSERKSKRRSSALRAEFSSQTEIDAEQSRSESEKTAVSRGVFRLAETVSIGSFSDLTAARKLHKRITELSLIPRNASGVSQPQYPSSTDRLVGSSSPLPKSGTVSAPPGRADQNSGGFQDRPMTPSLSLLNFSTARAKASATEYIEKEKSKPLRHRSPAAHSLRFKVIHKHEVSSSLRRSASTSSLKRKLQSGMGSKRPWHTSNRPPEIRSKKEKDAEAIFGKIIDAVAQSDQVLSEQRPPKGRLNRKSNPKETNNDPELEALDAKFAEMLGDYLKENNLEPSKDIQEAISGQKRERDPSSNSTSESGGDQEESKDKDYVYDIYYRDMLPSRTGPQGAAETGLQPLQVPGRSKGFTAQSTLPDSMVLPRVQGGALAPPESHVIPSQFLGLDIAGAGAIVAELDGFEDSDDELEVADEGDAYESYDEGEDEDSNDEDFYRNDYPEQELPDEEEVDFGSDYGSSGGGDDPYALSDASF